MGDRVASRQSSLRVEDRQPDGRIGSLLDSLVERSTEETEGLARGNDRIAEFLAEGSPAKALAACLGWSPRSPHEWDTACRSLERAIARIDRLLTDQVNAILHQPRFQKLEALWRGLFYLVEAAETGREILDNESGRGALVLKILNVSKRELAKDLANPSEFDQSKLFKKVYEEEFGTAGGNPFGLLVGDYSFSHRLGDVDLLTAISGVAAASFAPFVSGAAPELLGLDEFGTLEQPLSLSQGAQDPEHLKWRAFRDHPDSRFVALVLPRVLLRRPYQGADAPPTPFAFAEEVEAPDRSKFLWGNAAFAFASVVMRAYAACGWFADIRGAHRGLAEGGLVTGLPTHCFGTDSWGVAVKMGTEMAIDDVQEKELTKLGLMPLCDCKDTGFSVFYANPSVYQPKKFDDAAATASERMESMLQYTLCASRFAHYIKVMGRDKVGSLQSSWELENFFNNWLIKYVTSDSKAPPSTKARYPLRVAEAQVLEIPGKPGNFRVVMRLCPHYQLDQLNATIRLVPHLRAANAM